MKKSLIFGVVGGTILIAASAVAYLKREAIKRDIKFFDEIINGMTRCSQCQHATTKSDQCQYSPRQRLSL